jgi:hypothetical protein
MDFDSALHRRIQDEVRTRPVADDRGEDFRPSELTDPAAMLWYMLYPVDSEGLSEAERKEVRKDKETLWLVVDGKHDMDDSEKRKLNVMRFVLESLVASFVPDGMYDPDERDENYESFKASFREALPRTLSSLDRLFHRALSRINPRYDPERLNKNRVGDIKEALHERFTLKYPIVLPARIDPRSLPFVVFSEANTLYPPLSFSDWVADFDASFIRNQPWPGETKDTFSLGIAETRLTLTSVARRDGARRDEKEARRGGGEIVGKIDWPSRQSSIEEVHVVPAREEKQEREERVWDSSGFADEMLSQEGIGGDLWPQTPFLERLRSFPRNGRTVDRIVLFVAKFGANLRKSVSRNKKVPNLPNHLLALFIVMKNNIFPTKDPDERLTNQRRSRKGNPDIAKSEQKVFWDGMKLDDYIVAFFSLGKEARKKHLDFFFDGWYRRTFSSLDAVIQLNERSDLVFGRARSREGAPTSVEMDYDLFLDFVSQIEFTVQGGAAENATAGVSAFTPDCFRHIRQEEDTRLTVGRGPHLLRRPEGGAGVGGFKVYCYKSGLSWAQTFCLSFAVAFDNGLREFRNRLGDPLVEVLEFRRAIVDNALVDAFVRGVYIKSFADKAMGVAAKEVHGEPARLGPGQEPGMGQMWNTGDSTAMIGLLQAKVDLVKLIAGQIVRFDRYSGTERPSAMERAEKSETKKKLVKEIKKLLAEVENM